MYAWFLLRDLFRKKAFDNTDLRPKERLPVAKELGESSIVFLVHPTLSEKEMQKIAESSIKVFERAKK